MVLGAIAAALDHDGFYVVEEPVQQGRGEGGVVVEDLLPVFLGGRFIDAAALAIRTGCRLQAGALDAESAFGEPEEDDPENRAGVFLGLQSGIGAELVGARPKALFQGVCQGIFGGGGDPVHQA